MDDVTGQTAIITGAGAGIGRALTVGLASANIHVVAIGRSGQGLDETVRLAQGAGSVESHVLDVSDAQALEAVFTQVVRARGGVDLLVNNAAVYPRALLADTSAADWARDVGINLNGVVFGCRAAIRTFPKGRPAVILNVGSFAHRGPSAGSALYCTTKAAVNGFTRAVAAELASQGSSIVVNEWVPGEYRTQMGRPDGDDPQIAVERLLAVWQMSKNGAGGRIFAEGEEQLPPRSLKSRLKALLLGQRR